MMAENTSFSTAQPEVTGRVQHVTAIDAVLGRVRALASRRIQWLSHIRQTDGHTSGKRTPTDLQIAMDDRDNPAAEAEWYTRSAHLAATNAEIEALTSALLADTETPLGQLCSTFALSETERDLFQVCLALEADPAMGSLFAHLQGDTGHRYVTDALASRLCGHGGAPLWSASGPLARWELLKVGETAAGEPTPLSLDPHIHHYIRGQRLLDSALLGRATMLEPKEPLPTWAVRETATRTQRAVEAGANARVWMFGSPGSGRRTFAAIVSAALGGSALAIDITGVPEDEWARLFMRAQRQAILSNAALAWHGEGVERRWPSAPALVPLQFVIADTTSRVVPVDGVVDEVCVMPLTTVAERRDLWKRFVPASTAWRAEDLQQLAERFRLNVGQLETVGRSGTQSVDGAREVCRRLTRDRMGELGKVLDCPFKREDLTLPARLNEMLDEFLFEARERVLFWENERARRLFPRGTGLVGLMAGPPGTGKTMAAQVIAAELGLDLVRIDLATVVSKYIGETAKNLQRIFTRASRDERRPALRRSGRALQRSGPR